MRYKNKLDGTNVVGVWGLQNQRSPTGNFNVVSVPNHQLDDTGYKTYSKKTATVTEKPTSPTLTFDVSKKCKCSHPEFSHESEGDKICRIIGCHCWGFVPVSEVII